MPSTFTTLTSGSAGSTEKSGRRRKIDRTQWPELLARRDAGASQAQIAEEYGVSQGTISQILKRARAEVERTGSAVPASGAAVNEAAAHEAAEDDDLDAPASDDGEEPAPAGADAADAAPAGADAADAGTNGGDGTAAAARAEVAARSPGRPSGGTLSTRSSGSGSSGSASSASGSAAPGSAPSPAAPSPAGAGESAAGGAAPSEASTDTETSTTAANPLAQRLLDAAQDCARLVDRGGAKEETLGDAVHEVRRALAAIEIDTAKRGANAKPAPRQPVSPPAAERPAEPTPAPHRADPTFGPARPSTSAAATTTAGGRTRAAAEAAGMQTGRIKFFKPDKGFGFIIPDSGGEDVFLGKDTVAAAGLDKLSQGDRVAFEPGPGNKGIEAKSIRLAS